MWAGVMITRFCRDSQQMASKRTNKDSAALSRRDKSHGVGSSSPAGMVLPKRPDVTGAGEAAEEGAPRALLVGTHVGQPLWRTVRRVLEKLTLELPWDPAVLLVSVFSEDVSVSERGLPGCVRCSRCRT